jgi:hypothetical protein
MLPVDVQKPNQHGPLATCPPSTHRQLRRYPDTDRTPPGSKDGIHQA